MKQWSSDIGHQPVWTVTPKRGNIKGEPDNCLSLLLGGNFPATTQEKRREAET